MGIKIGTVAKMTGLSPSGIRFLEEQGIVLPSEGRNGTYRNYTMDDVCALLEYQNYRKCGIAADEISVLLKSSDLKQCGEIFDRQCDEMENTIREKLRLLHFLRHRKHSLELTAQKNTFCELTQRPAIIWMPLNITEGEYSSWPEDTAFEIPYTDSVLKFDSSALLRGSKTIPGCGIGIYESDILNSSFFGNNDIQYFPKHMSVHMIVNIENDFSISDREAATVKEKLCSILEKDGYGLSESGCALTKRILSTSENGKTVRYDHLWIDVDKKSDKKSTI